MQKSRTIDEDRLKASVEKNKRIAESIEKQQEATEGTKAAIHTNSVATTDAHVGLAPHDTPKPQEMEDRAVDKAAITGDPHLSRTDVTTEGKGVTDQVTVSPGEAQPQGGAQTYSGKLAAAAQEAESGKSAKKTSAKKSR